jgi:DNA repair ATPase RecN
MANEPENILLAYMRRFDEKLDRVAEDVRDLKSRVTALVEGIVGIHRRMDRFELRLDRIEKRLDLVDISR